MYEFEKKKLLNSLNEDILELLKNEQCIIAGGSITSLFTRNEINDIDIYFRSKESLINALKEIKGQSTIMAFTDKATMFVKDSSEYAYQFIHFKFFDNPQEIFDTFDFTVCMGAYDFKAEDFIFHPSFLTHNSQRLLKVNDKTAYPIMTALRVQKYLDKGYTISKPEFIKIMLVINQLNIITYKQLKEQMGGMYGVNYDKLFKDIQDNDKFDINVVIETLSDIILDDSYFELPFKGKTDFEHEVEKYINNSYIEDGYKIYKRSYKDNSYGYTKKEKVKYIIVKDNHLIDVLNLDGIDIDDDKLSTDLPEIHVYKNVRRTEDNKLFSFWDEKFQYTLLEEVVAKNEDGLYFSLTLEECGTYRDYNGSVVIECIVSLEDYVGDSKFIKCIPIEVVRDNITSKQITKIVNSNELPWE